MGIVVSLAGFWRRVPPHRSLAILPLANEARLFRQLWCGARLLDRPSIWPAKTSSSWRRGFAPRIARF
jgi:hypothetical protein